MSKTKFITITCYLAVCLIILAIVDVIVGSTNLFAQESLANTIFYQIRLPKMITAIIAGSGLALCGLLMQTLFRNPLAGPYALGVSSGSSLFVAIATMALSSINVLEIHIMGKSAIVFSSILGAFLVALIILMLSQKNKSNMTILLIGLMLAQILGALQGLIEYLSSSESLKTFVIWGMGNVGSTTLNDIALIAPFYVLSIIWAYFLIKSLNAILLNEEYAQNLGINIYKLRISIIIITSLLVGVITAFCGPIAFVGVSVPIASRLFFKTAHHVHQITFCLLLGSIVVLLADITCQILSAHVLIPLNTITTIIGSPIIIYLLFNSKFRIT